MLEDAKFLALTYIADFWRVTSGAIMILIAPEENLYVS